MASNDNLRYIVITAMPTALSGSFAWQKNVGMLFTSMKSNVAYNLISETQNKKDMKFHKYIIHINAKILFRNTFCC